MVNMWMYMDKCRFKRQYFIYFQKKNNGRALLCRRGSANGGNEACRANLMGTRQQENKNERRTGDTQSYRKRESKNI